MNRPTRPSEAAADAFWSGAEDLLVTTDATGCITWRHPNFDASTGLGDDVIGRRLTAVAHPDSDPAAVAALQRGFDDGTGVFGLEIALPRQSDTAQSNPLWCVVRATPFDDAAGRSFACVLHDRSELRQQTHKAQRLAEFLDIAQEFGRLGVWERDILTGEGYWDQHVFRFFDMAPEEGTPNHRVAREKIHPDDRDSVMYAESTKTPGRYSRRYRLNADNKVVRAIHSQWEIKADSHGTPTRAIGIMVDDTEAFQMAQSLTQANARLELAVEIAGIGLWRHDLKTNLVHYDDMMFRMLGWEPKPDGMHVDEVRSRIHPDDIPAVVASSRRALATNEHVDVEARYRRGDGSWRMIMTRRRVERDAGGRPIAFIGVGLDVTDREAHARASLELARRLEAITHAAGLGAWSASVGNKDMEWNRGMYELYDISPERAPPSFGEFVALRVHPDDRERFRRNGLAWLASGKGAFEIEFRAVLSDGTIRWILSRADRETRGAEVRLYGIAMDVTDRKRTEAALQEASDRVALAAHGAGIGTWILDTQTGAALWDDQMFLLRGLEPRDTALTEDERYAITHVEDRDRIRNALAESSKTGASVTYEFRVLRPDGSWRWLASRSIAVRNDDGRIVRQTGVNWDVTEAKTNELERHERMAAQRENQAKSQFLARISHELRTPLNAVLGFSQLLMAETPPLSAEQRRNAEHIHAAGKHLLSLINDVIDLSSMQSGELKMAFSAVDLSELVEGTLHMFLPQARAKDILVHLEPSRVMAWADATRVRQLIINLVSNAIKYTPNGGEVFVSVRHSEANVELRVRDTGRGIAQEQMRHLFEPFNRLGNNKEDIEGTGIGLAVVKAIAEGMGGEVHVRSQLGIGSEFVVTLPAADSADLLSAAAPSSFAALDANNRSYSGTILYIEDNPVNVLIVDELISMFPGLTMASESTAYRGVARARQLLPDLVLIDMQLPDFDGLEVLKRLRADPITADIPCIALSANALAEDVERALDAGMNDYWTKPIDFRRFGSEMRRRFSR
jgi:PAS domain S-box-containing protein